MLEKCDLDKHMSHRELDAELDGLLTRIMVLQQDIRKLKIPVVIVFEGWGAAGKGSSIASLIMNLDPRGFKVFSIRAATADEQRFPLMRRFWDKIPSYGNISIFDRSWYRAVSSAAVEEKLSREELNMRINEIINFETQLSDDGYVIIKFFMHISKKEQKKRFGALANDRATNWRVNDSDWVQNKAYGRYYSAFDDMLERTNAPVRWHIIESTDRDFAVNKIYHTVISALEHAIERKTNPVAVPGEIRVDPLITPMPIPNLRDVELDKQISKKDYQRALREGQEKLFKLHNKLYRTKTPMIIAYEGWDAAGKGGNIKRITRALDPRGYEVVPISAPSALEKNHQHLWRFWQSLPKDGHIAIFDRTWYGRVMVERIEGFCTEDEWKRAYDEINHFEKSLYDWGAIIIKFWLQIDSAEQLARFNDRLNTPEKRWKITDEDWRNREKWDEYETAVDEMLKRTNTDYAPWVIVESNNKYYARIKAINTVTDAIERHFKR